MNLDERAHRAAHALKVQNMEYDEAVKTRNEYFGHPETRNELRLRFSQRVQEDSEDTTQYMQNYFYSLNAVSKA